MREFCKHAVACEWTAPSLLGVLYQAGDDRWLPDEVRGESVTPRGIARPRHRLPEPHRPVRRASNAELVALLAACCSARDRFIVLALARGLRRGELVSLRREDVHFVLDATSLGCPVEGAHLHVVRRDVAPRGGSQSRGARGVCPQTLCSCRHGTRIGGSAPPAGRRRQRFLVRESGRPPIGVPDAARRDQRAAGCAVSACWVEKTVHPHQLRHGFASDVLDSGGSLDEVQELLGHASVHSTQPYIHPAPHRLRDAVERVASYRSKEEPMTAPV